MDDETSGVTICVRRLAEELGRLSLDVGVCSVGAAGRHQRDGYRDERFPKDRSGVPLLRAMCFSNAMQKGLQSKVQKANIIHNHGLWLMPNVYGSRVAGKGRDTPLVFSPHGMLSPGAVQFSRAKKRAFWLAFQGRAAHSMSCFHATCEEEHDDIRAYGLKAPVAIIPNGVDLPEWKERPVDRKRRRIISLGRIHPKKALDRLVAAWGQLESDFPGWDLLIIGPNQNGYAEQLTEQASALGLKNVTISGSVFGAEKDELLRSSDLFALPTLSENFALTVAESLAVGAPVISSKGAPWQGLEENACGWWIDHGVEPLTHTLRQAMSLASEQRVAMGLRGRDWMARDFAWDSIAGQMAAVYGWLDGKGDVPECVRVD